MHLNLAIIMHTSSDPYDNYKCASWKGDHQKIKYEEINGNCIKILLFFLAYVHAIAAVIEPIILLRV